MSHIKKVYGPYMSKKDGRERVLIYYTNGLKQTVSYPKYIVEKALGYKLDQDKIVHHIDENPLNNSLDNLEIITRPEHARLHALENPAKIGEFVCPICSKVFNRPMSDVRHHQEVRKQAGPFCSKSCSGFYGTEIQNNR